MTISARYRQSEFNKWRRCRRAHHWAYTDPIRPTSTELLPVPNKSDIGTLAHVGFAELHKGADIDDALNSVRHAKDEFLNGETNDAWDKTLVYAIAATMHYDDHLKTGAMTGQEILGIEQEWTAPLPFEREVWGTTDLIVHDPLTGIVIVDMKTVTNFAQSPQEVDFQLRTYAWSYWKNTGVVPARAEHRMVRRVLYGGTGKPPFVEPYGIHINETILLSHEAQMMVMANEIDRARESELSSPYLYPNPHKDCDWDCNYRDICPLVDDGADVESVVQLNYVRTSDE